MLTDPLTDVLTETLARLNQMQEAHAHAQAYEAAQQRTSHLHVRTQQLENELTGMRVLTESLAGLSCAPSVLQLQRATLSDLKKSRPRSMGQLGRHLVDNDLGLLEIAEYLGWCIALAQERRAQAAEIVLAYLGSAGTHGSENADAEAKCSAIATFLRDHRQLKLEQMDELRALTARRLPSVP